MLWLLRRMASLHDKVIHSRRVQILSDIIVKLIPAGSFVIDIGCGDGMLGGLLEQKGSDIQVEGYEILARPDTPIPVYEFDGRCLPLEDASADITLLVDTLHHTEVPFKLLSEASRVARMAVIIKDHRTSRPDAKIILRFMDWVGNRPYGVSLPYNYWSEKDFEKAWRHLGLEVEYYQTSFGLYPWPASWCFETGLHFLAKLRHGSSF